jgi:hypothetical protein
MLQILQKLQLLSMVSTAGLRERYAECAKYAANAANSEWLLAPDQTRFYVGNVVNIGIVVSVK